MTFLQSHMVHSSMVQSLWSLSILSLAFHLCHWWRTCFKLWVRPLGAWPQEILPVSWIPVSRSPVSRSPFGPSPAGLFIPAAVSRSFWRSWCHPVVAEGCVNELMVIRLSGEQFGSLMVWSFVGPVLAFWSGLSEPLSEMFEGWKQPDALWIPLTVKTDFNPLFPLSEL